MVVANKAETNALFADATESATENMNLTIASTFMIGSIICIGLGLGVGGKLIGKSAQLTFSRSCNTYPLYCLKFNS